jgi:hypothetical protein
VGFGSAGLALRVGHEFVRIEVGQFNAGEGTRMLLIAFGTILFRWIGLLLHIFIQ